MTILACYDIQAGVGGVETITMRIDRELLQRKYRYVCVLPGASFKDRKWEGLLSTVYVGPLSTLSWKQSPFNFIRLIRFYKRILHIEEPDVILVHWAPFVLFMRFLQVMGYVEKSVPIIVYEHGALGEISTYSISPLYRWLYLRGLAKANHVVCGGSDYAQAVTRMGKVSVHAIGLPINLPCFQVPRPKSGKFHILFVGRFDNRPKRIDRLLKACSLLPQDCAWTLQLVGDGPDREFLQQLAEKLGIERHCVWSGWQEDPWSVVQYATIMAFPSDYEGFGSVIVEAMARGIPVLASDCNFGPRTIIQTGVNGWLVARTDSAFATKLLQLALADIPIPSADMVIHSVSRFGTAQVVQTLLDDIEQLQGANVR